MNVMIFGDTIFSVDMAWGFEELGHSVKLIFPKTVQELDAQLNAIQPDLLITLGSPAFFAPELLNHLQKRPVPSAKYIHWDTDGITWADIEMNHIRLLEPDLVFTVCPDMLSFLRQKNIPSEMLFYAYSPVSHHPGPSDSKNPNQIAFVGGAYPNILSMYPNHYRRQSLDVLFKPLLDNGYRIDLYGDNRHKQVLKSLYGMDIPDDWLHGRCPYERTWQIYSGCVINLITQNHDRTITKRTFEVLGSGGLALSFSNSAIREYFTPGKDLAVTSSPTETLELVEYYLSHPEDCQNMREHALESAKSHTYKQRAESIVSRVMPG